LHADFGLHVQPHCPIAAKEDHKEAQKRISFHQKACPQTNVPDLPSAVEQLGFTTGGRPAKQADVLQQIIQISAAILADRECLADLQTLKRAKALLSGLLRVPSAPGSKSNGSTANPVKNLQDERLSNEANQLIIPGTSAKERTSSAKERTATKLPSVSSEVPDFERQSWLILHDIVDRKGNGTVDQGELLSFLKDSGILQSHQDGLALLDISEKLGLDFRKMHGSCHLKADEFVQLMVVDK
jgi:hypothetical protein